MAFVLAGTYELPPGYGSSGAYFMGRAADGRYVVDYYPGGEHATLLTDFAGNDSILLPTPTFSQRGNYYSTSVGTTYREGIGSDAENVLVTTPTSEHLITGVPVMRLDAGAVYGETDLYGIASASDATNPSRPYRMTASGTLEWLGPAGSGISAGESLISPAGRLYLQGTDLYLEVGGSFSLVGAVPSGHTLLAMAADASSVLSYDWGSTLRVTVFGGSATDYPLGVAVADIYATATGYIGVKSNYTGSPVVVLDYSDGAVDRTGIWTPQGGLVPCELPDPAGTWTYAGGITPDGRIAVGDAEVDGTTRPVVWDAAGTATQLPVPVGAVKVQALGCTADGLAIVGAVTDASFNKTHLVLWVDDAPPAPPAAPRLRKMAKTTYIPGSPGQPYIAPSTVCTPPPPPNDGGGGLPPNPPPTGYYVYQPVDPNNPAAGETRAYYANHPGGAYVCDTVPQMYFVPDPTFPGGLTPVYERRCYWSYP